MNDTDRLEQLRTVHGIQAYNGNWNYDPYMHGLYNGLEMALATMEDREPRFKKAPRVWLSEKKPTSKLTKKEGK